MICNDCQVSFSAHKPIIKDGIARRDSKLNYWLCKNCNEKKSKKEK